MNSSRNGGTIGLATYFAAFLSADVASQVQDVAVAWHIFTLHHRPFDLGLVGLTLFLPPAALVLVTGLLLVIGTARAFAAPAERGMLVALVPAIGYLRVAAASGFREVVAGSAATLAVVAVRSLIFPQLRRFDRFSGSPA